jgi:hypothetical protein
MADDAHQIVNGDSVAAVAYALLLGIAKGEGKVGQFSGVVMIDAEKDWILISGMLSGDPGSGGTMMAPSITNFE